MALSKGDRLGPYEILALLGKGGMGEVYRAHDPRLNRDVAIKISFQQFDERFEREARAIAAFNHPNICQIYDVGPDYLVMELVEGPTLRDRIHEGAIPLHEALRIADQIAEALAAAHEKLITHRDLKPGNVKIKDDGTVKVLDFGLAKLGTPASAGDSEKSPTVSMTLTKSGVILGTAAYMSPEQARGKAVDARADIWAFGVVFYEMLAARRLFRGEDVTETLASVVKEAPDLSAIPRQVRRLIEACLQKDPKRRLQAIGDRHLLLQEPERQGFRWLWPAVAGAAALGAVVLGWMHFREAPAALPNLRYQLTRPGDSGFAQIQLSPDGRQLAFVSRSGANDRLYVRALDSLDEREFPGTDGATYPFWSPDSAHIAFFSQGKLRQVAVGGGPPTNITDAPDPRGGSWGQNGSIVFSPAVSGGLMRVSSSGGQATSLRLPRSGSDQGDSLRFPVFLPDSDRFLYTIEAKTLEGRGVYVGSLNGDPPVRILPDLSITTFVRLRNSRSAGFLLFLRETTIMAQAFDEESLKISSEAFPVADDVRGLSGNSGFADFTVSANGALIYAAGGNPSQEREIVWLDQKGKRGQSILKQKGITDFALSPDGTQLIYSLADQTVPGDLWLHDVARGASQRFTVGFSSAYSPVWSPDGATVVFAVYPEDRLYAKKVASVKEEALPVSGTNTYPTSWSADGKLLAYSQMGLTTKDDLWLFPMEGERKPRPFKGTAFFERSAQISPDQRWILYSSDPSGQLEVYIESMLGGAPRQVSVGGGMNPHWRANGRELYFISGRKVMAVDVKPGPDLTFSAPHEMFTEPNLLTDTRGVTYQPSTDGKQFLMLLPVGGAPAARPLTVVSNWQAALRK
jgi:serine/threonine protein kinase